MRKRLKRSGNELLLDVGLNRKVADVPYDLLQVLSFFSEMELTIIIVGDNIMDIFLWFFI